MKDRWESYVPVSTNERAITYHFKVDYEYNQMSPVRAKEASSRGLQTRDY
jgi:hypothetical protein